MERITKILIGNFSICIAEIAVYIWLPQPYILKLFLTSVLVFIIVVILWYLKVRELNNAAFEILAKTRKESATIEKQDRNNLAE